MNPQPNHIGRVSAGKYPQARLTGLGDLVALAAIPAAKLIDRMLGTDLQHCQGCHGPGGRQERLNAAVPFRQSTL